MRSTKGSVGHELDDQSCQIVTAVESLAKGGEVGADIFGVVQGAGRTGKTGCQIAQHRADPFELRQVAWLAGADDVDRVGAAGLGASEHLVRSIPNCYKKNVAARAVNSQSSVALEA